MHNLHHSPGRHHTGASGQPHHCASAAGAGFPAQEAPRAPRHQGVPPRIVHVCALRRLCARSASANTAASLPAPQPANILMSLQGEAKIADFGISAFVANTVANVRQQNTRMSKSVPGKAQWGSCATAQGHGCTRHCKHSPACLHSLPCPVPDIHRHCDLHVARAHRGQAVQLPGRHLVSLCTNSSTACLESCLRQKHTIRRGLGNVG